MLLRIENIIKGGTGGTENLWRRIQVVLYPKRKLQSIFELLGIGELFFFITDGPIAHCTLAKKITG
jgi:hypothetical protein